MPTDFNTWLTQAAGKIADPALRQQVTNTLSQAATAAPEFRSFTENNLLLHGDYSRVIHEARVAQKTATEAAQAERLAIEAEQVRLLNEKQKAEQVLANAKSVEEQLLAYDRLYNRLNELEVFNMIYTNGEDREFPVPTPLTTALIQEEDMPQFTDEEVAAMKGWIASLPKPGETIVTPPVNPAAAPIEQPSFLTHQEAQQHFQNVFAASTIGTARLHEAAQRYTKLTGKEVSVAEHAKNWLESGEKLEDYVEKAFELSKLETEATTKNFESLVESRAQQIIEARVAAGSLNPAVAAPLAPVAPLFGLLQQAPTNAQVVTPPPASTPPENTGATPPPASRNSPEAFQGIDAAALALQTNKYAGERYNPLRPMGN